MDEYGIWGSGKGAEFADGATWDVESTSNNYDYTTTFTCKVPDIDCTVTKFSMSQDWWLSLIHI